MFPTRRVSTSPTVDETYCTTPTLIEVGQLSLVARPVQLGDQSFTGQDLLSVHPTTFN